MTTENDLQKRLEGLGHAVGSDDLLIDNVISRIEAMPAPEADKNLVRRWYDKSAFGGKWLFDK
jgi:hypothetical protein